MSTTPPSTPVANRPTWQLVAHPTGLALMLDFPEEPTLIGGPLTLDEAERLATALNARAALIRLADSDATSPVAPGSAPAVPGPCAACGATEEQCLDTILHGGDGDPDVCCSHCDHPPSSDATLPVETASQPLARGEETR